MDEDHAPCSPPPTADNITGDSASEECSDGRTSVGPGSTPPIDISSMVAAVYSSPGRNESPPSPHQSTANNSSSDSTASAVGIESSPGRSPRMSPSQTVSASYPHSVSTNASMLQGTTIGACPDHVNGRPTGVECSLCDSILTQSRNQAGPGWNLSRNSCKTLKCPKCNWHYKYLETLEIHMKEKHPETETTCAYCVTGQQHPKLARGETYTCGYKPYRCEVCNYSTTTKGNLSIHMQSDKHLNNMQEIQSSASCGGTTSPNDSQDGGPACADLATAVARTGSPSPLSTPTPTPTTPPAARQNAPPQQSSPKMLRCEMCNYETTVGRNLRIHMTSEKHTHNVALARQGPQPVGQPLPANIPPVFSSSSSSSAPCSTALHITSPQNTTGSYQTESAVMKYLQHHMMMAAAASNGGSSAAMISPETIGRMLLLKQQLDADQIQTNCQQNTNEGNNAELQQQQQQQQRVVGDRDVDDELTGAHESLFTCVACCNASSDSIDTLVAHIHTDRSRSNESEVVVSANGGVAGNQSHCLLCNYKTALRANFQLHCKTDKHMQRLSHYNHVREGGRRTEQRLAKVMSGGLSSAVSEFNHISPTVDMVCNACQFRASSVHKMHVHIASESHQIAALLFIHMARREADLLASSAPKAELRLICSVCDVRSVSKRGMMSHIRSLAHLQAEQRHQMQRSSSGQPSQSDIADIVRIELVQSSDDNDSIMCPLCQERFGQKSDMEQHAVQVHSVTTEGLERLSMIATSMKQLQSSLSPPAEDVKSNNQAAKYHDPARPYKCETCRESFTQRNILLVHQNSVSHLQRVAKHSESSADGCELLKKLPFVRKSGGSVAAFKCNICRTDCDSGHQLELHMESSEHQSNASRLHELILAGKIDLSRPLIEQPENCSIAANSHQSSTLAGQKEDEPCGLKRSVDDMLSPRSLTSTGSSANSASSPGAVIVKKISSSAVGNLSSTRAVESSIANQRGVSSPTSTPSSPVSSPMANLKRDTTEIPAAMQNDVVRNLINAMALMSRQGGETELSEPPLPPPPMPVLKGLLQDYGLELDKHVLERLQMAESDKVATSLAPNFLFQRALLMQSQLFQQQQQQQQHYNSLQQQHSPSAPPSASVQSALDQAMMSMNMQPPLVSSDSNQNLLSVDSTIGNAVDSQRAKFGNTQTASSRVQASDPNKRARTRITDEQLKVLRSHFDINNSPTDDQINMMSTKTGLPLKVIKHWFRNTLFKERQKNKDSPYNFNVPPSTSLNLDDYAGDMAAKIGPNSPAVDKSNTALIVSESLEMVESKDVKSELVEPDCQQQQQPVVVQNNLLSVLDSHSEIISMLPKVPVLPNTVTPPSVESSNPRNLQQQQQQNIAHILSKLAIPNMMNCPPSGDGEPLGQAPWIAPAGINELHRDLLNSSCNSVSSSDMNRSQSPNMVSALQLGMLSSCSAGGGNSKRANRTRFTDYQIRVLQEFFENNAYPKDDDLEYLSKLLGLSPRVIVVWFQNARQKARKVYENQPQLGSGVSQADSAYDSNTDGQLHDKSHDSVGPTDEEDVANSGRFTRTSACNYQCKKCLLVFQRYYELIRHQKQHCYKEEDARKSAQAQRAAAQAAAQFGHLIQTDSSALTSQVNEGGGNGEYGMSSDVDSINLAKLMASSGQADKESVIASLREHLNAAQLKTKMDMSPNNGSAADSLKRKSVSGADLNCAPPAPKKSSTQSTTQQEDQIIDVVSEHQASMEQTNAMSAVTAIQTWFERVKNSLSVQPDKNCESNNTASASQQELYASLAAAAAASATATTESPSGETGQSFLQQNVIAAAAAANVARSMGLTELGGSGDSNFYGDTMKRFFEDMEKNGHHQTEARAEDGLNDSSTSSGVDMTRDETANGQGDELVNGDKFHGQSDFGALDLSSPVGDEIIMNSQSKVHHQHHSSPDSSILNAHGGTTYKRFRTQMSAVQVKILRCIFEVHKNPTMLECATLGREIGLQKRVVQVWFQNARAKDKRGRMQLMQQQKGGSMLASDEQNDNHANVLNNNNVSSTSDECHFCNVIYSAKCPMAEHLFTTAHLVAVKLAIEEDRYEPETPGQIGSGSHSVGSASGGSNGLGGCGSSGASSSGGSNNGDLDMADDVDDNCKNERSSSGSTPSSTADRQPPYNMLIHA